MSVSNLARRRGKILEEIMRHHRARLPQVMREAPLADLRAFASVAPPTAPLTPLLRASGTAVIATCLKASPVQGLLVPGYAAAQRARLYAAGGATAVAVWTDARHYQGYLADVGEARATLPPRVPVIRNDFIFDPYQLYETRVAGADAVMLIAAIVGEGDLRQLVVQAEQLQLTPIVEVHAAAEVERANAAGASVICVNMRDWQTFEVEPETAVSLRALIPQTTIALATGGIKKAAEMRRLRDLHFDGVLIGEPLIRNQQPEQMLAMLVRNGRPA